MNNLIILGCGRSGTSAVAGLFRNSGAYFGEQPLAATASNVKGYYEDFDVNTTNNEVIWQMLSWGWFNPLRSLFRPRAERDLRCWWLTTPRIAPRIEIPAATRDRMLRHFRRTPFCLKDPRFNTTLASWRPYLPARTRFIVAFRDPDRTVDSILRDAQTVYTPSLPIDERDAYVAWHRVYTRLLDDWSQEGDWLFVDFDRVLDGEALAALAAFADTPVDATELDRKLSKARAASIIHHADAETCRQVHARLLERARSDIERWGGRMISGQV